MDWLVDGWLHLNRSLQDAAPEGSCKTIWGCWLSVCIAAGLPVFGHAVRQGSVVIVDDETPRESLERHLSRFAAGIGEKYGELPIYLECWTGFRFGERLPDRLSDLLKWAQPVFIRFDSMISMLPKVCSGENDATLGLTLGHDMQAIRNLCSHGCSTSLVVHTKKGAASLSIDELADGSLSPQTVVRGHGGIVGQGSDTTYILKKISEHPRPTRFGIITKSRRDAVYMPKVVYAELVEEEYGKGWARIDEIPEPLQPPSHLAKLVYHFFLDGQFHTSSDIGKVFALNQKSLLRECLDELLRNRVILNSIPQTYVLNAECAGEYVEMLKDR